MLKLFAFFSNVDLCIPHTSEQKNFVLSNDNAGIKLWFPCEARIFFKIVCYVINCIHGLAPYYLSELLVVKHYQDLTSYGDRTFSRFGPKLCNALPIDIRMVNSLDYFKAKLKHYFLFFSKKSRTAN